MKKGLLILLPFLSISSLVGCQKGPTGIGGVSMDSTIEVYETTGTKSKILTRGSDMHLSPYSYTGNTEVHVSNTTDITFDGFGCALTHSSAYLLSTTEETVRRNLLKEMFSNEGIGANFSNLRIPLGTSDYTLPDQPFYTFDDNGGSPDYTLANFSIEKDKEFFIPMIKEILAINPNVKIYASPWSAPAWMKNSESLIGGTLVGSENEELTGLTNEEIAYAKYLVKVVQAYKAEGININYLSVINEPFVGNVKYPSMQLPSSQHFRVAKELCTRLENAGLTDVKLDVYDHNVDTEEDLSFELFIEPLLQDPITNKYVDTFALHCYSKYWADIYEAFLAIARENHPGKRFVISEVTETQSSVDFAQNLGWSACNVTVGPMNAGISNALYWNLCLTANGDPVKGNSAKCFGVATLENNEYSFNPAFYSMAHTSKFVTTVNGQKPMHIKTTCTNPGQICASSYFLGNKNRVIVLANISDVLTDTVDLIFDENKFVQVHLQPQSITTLVVKERAQEDYRSVEFNHIDLYQHNYSSYGLEISLEENDANMEFFISRNKDSFLPGEKITTTFSGGIYKAEISQTPGDFYLNAKSATRSSSLLLTIPRLTPRIEEVVNEDTGDYYINTFFGLSSDISWSSFCDPEGKNVYKSTKDYFDESAIHVNVQKDGSVDPIQILTGNYADPSADPEIRNYFIVMNGKNGLTTFYSSAVTFREDIIEEDSISISLEEIGHSPYLVFTGNYLKSDYEDTSLILKDNAYERYASSNTGTQTLLMKLDLRCITTLGKWYDIMLERGNGISLDMYEENCEDMDQKITCYGITYEFKEWSGYLKVNAFIK